LWYVY